MSDFYIKETVSSPAAQEVFTGVDAFAERCLEVGEVALKIIQQGRQDISTPAGRDVARTNADTLLKSQVFDREIRNPVADHYERLIALIALREKKMSGEELYEKLFKISPGDSVDATWLAGGLIFWCSDHDYEKVFIEARSTDVDTAIKRARESAAVALGEIYVDDIKKDVPIGMVKYEQETKERFHDTAIPDVLKLEVVESIYLKYSSDGVDYENVIIKIDQDDGRAIIRVIDLIVEQEYEKTEDIQLTQEPELIVRGPYSIVFKDDTVSFVYQGSESDNNTKGSVLEVTYDDVTADGAMKEAIKQEKKHLVAHELQHLLNSLYRPIRLKKERFPGPEHKTKGEAIDAAAEFILHGPLDKHLRDEFLAQLAGEDREIVDIAAILVGQVENMGLLYNYLSYEDQTAASAIKGHRDKFANISNGAYLVLAKASEGYKELVTSVSWTVLRFEMEYNYTRTELIAFLAPHPFHTWPTVLKAIDRHIKRFPQLVTE